VWNSALSVLTDVQRYWTAVEDTDALIFALEYFDVMMYGSRTELFSDHNPQRYLVNCVPKSAKLTRWALSLSRYDIHVHHIKGVENISADFLSRCTK
jgi:hypothetical protein